MYIGSWTRRRLATQISYRKKEAQTTKATEKESKRATYGTWGSLSERKQQSSARGGQEEDDKPAGRSQKERGWKSLSERNRAEAAKQCKAKVVQDQVKESERAAKKARVAECVLAWEHVLEMWALNATEGGVSQLPSQSTSPSASARFTSAKVQESGVIIILFIIMFVHTHTHNYVYQLYIYSRLAIWHFGFVIVALAQRQRRRQLRQLSR